MKLLPKENNYLNEWNEHVAEFKLDDLCTDYFAKQKKHQAKEQGISSVQRLGEEEGIVV